MQTIGIKLFPNIKKWVIKSILSLLLLLPLQAHAIFNDIKQNYYFSQEPIDVIIPCHIKDMPILPYCIESVRNYCNNVRRIIVVSETKLVNSAEWYPESGFPFSFNDIHKELTIGKGINQFHRTGWYYQQILKLYAPLLIPDISSNVLIVDADVVFLAPVTFQSENGAPLFNGTSEYHVPYFEHMDRFLPGLKRYSSYSGVAHHMLFQKSILNDLFQSVQEIHQKPLWKVFCNAVAEKDLPNAGASEYEIYFNFTLTKCPEAKIHFLKMTDVTSLSNIAEYKKNGYIYIAAHSHERMP